MLPPRVDCEGIVPGVSAVDYNAAGAPVTNTAILGDGNRRPKIDLASGVSCRSASTVGRIAFSRSAQGAAELIGKSCIAGAINDPKVYPKAGFPFEGKTDLLASGRWLPLKGVERRVFLAFHLISCSHPFPFAGLEYTGERKDQPGRQTSFGKTAESQDPPSSNSYSRKTQQSKNIVDEEPDKAKTRRNVDLAGKKRDQFPDLGKKYVTKVDIDFVPTILRTSAGASVIIGASVGDGGKERAFQPIDFVDAGQANQITGASNNKLKPAAALFLELAAGLTSSGRFSMVEFIRLDRRQRHDYLCTMPQIVDEDGVILPWCLVQDAGDKTHNRKISIGRAIELHATHYFLIPELAATEEGKSQAFELHLISDRSRSITRTADLIAAVGLHLSRSQKTSGKQILGSGVESVALAIPIEFQPLNSTTGSSARTALEFAMSFMKSAFHFASTPSTSTLPNSSE